jgi:predicted nucleotidyltransferase
VETSARPIPPSRAGATHGRALDLASRVAAQLAGISGIEAVVLGGSLARGAADGRSDVDLGLYYRRACPPDLVALRDLARVLDRRTPPPEVTALGAWGPWVNGGAWLEIEGVRVDWLFREVERVESVIEDCLAGRVSVDYYLGHPHGFHSHVYAAEAHFAVPLEDRRRVFAALSARVRTYPPRLRDALVTRFLFDAAFMLELARKPAARGDVFHVAGCLFRVVAALVQVLCALNERFFLNEKGAIAEIDTMPRRPRDFRPRVEGLLGEPGTSPAALGASVARAGDLLDETRALAGEPRP